MRIPSARFTDLDPGWHDERVGRDRKIRAHLRQLKALGPDMTVTQPVPKRSRLELTRLAVHGVIGR